MTHIAFDRLTKFYPGSDEPAVNNLTLNVKSGHVVGFLGPSGAGKTTTLKMLAGLMDPTAGTIRFDGEEIIRISPEKRGVVMVFQNYSLFPHMNVADNIGFGLKMQKMKKKEIKKRVGEMLDLVQLPDFEKRRPSQLSGGQRQRVALARALVKDPRVLLLDEPLSNLDLHLRHEMRDLILSIQQELAVTTVFVTHEQEDAVLLADQIALMFDGKLQQYAKSVEFFNRPATEKIAQFFGGVNFIPATRNGKLLNTAIGQFKFDVPDPQAIPTGKVKMTIRPEHIALNKNATDNCVSGIVKSQVFTGAHTHYMVQTGQYELQITRSSGLVSNLKEGDEVGLYLPPDRVWVIPDDQA